MTYILFKILSFWIVAYVSPLMMPYALDNVSITYIYIYINTI
jgi:hypothetical protein